MDVMSGKAKAYYIVGLIQNKKKSFVYDDKFHTIFI